MKALYAHQLWLQPILDTIAYARTDIHQRNNGKWEYYNVFYKVGTNVEQQVVAVISEVPSWDQGKIKTPDNRELGLLTAYCENPKKPGDPVEYYCPGWVNETL